MPRSCRGRPPPRRLRDPFPSLAVNVRLRRRECNSASRPDPGRGREATP